MIVWCSSDFFCQQISAASNGRYLRIAITHGPTAFQLLNIYAPASSAGARTDFFSDVMTLMESRSPMVVCGDFNCVIDPTLDRRSRSRLGLRSSDINTMQTLLASLQVIDVYRKRHPITPGFTWTRQHTQTAVRLDMFLVSSVLDHRISDVSVLPTAFSDHSGVLLTLRSSLAATRGPGVWKFNASFLSEPSFTRRINAFWLHWRYEKSRFQSLLQWWDVGETHLRAICGQYGATRRRRQLRTVKRLEMALQAAQQRIPLGDTEAISKVEHFRNRLKECERERIRGCQLRNKAQWLEKGETSEKFFTRRESVMGEKNHITELETNGVTVSTTAELLLTTHAFYSDLYQEQPIDEQASQYLLSRLDRHLSTEDSVVCDGPLTMDECTTALGQLKPHKSPGMDGLTVEFYRQFWPVLRDDLMAVFQTIYDNGYMSLS